MITAGLDVARLNFSHGTFEEHARRIEIIRKLSADMGKPVTILQDLPGPKIRVGEIPGGGITLIPGEQVILASGPIESQTGESASRNQTVIPIDFPELTQCVIPGSVILLDDGRLQLEALQVFPGEVAAKVIQGGVLTSHKGLNLPGANLPIEGITQRDREDLAFGLKMGVDVVAVSFVRTPQDIQIVRKAIHELAPEKADTLIIAKLERPEALENLEAILDLTDGVMVARGDLGVEMPPETVPIAQKTIINAASRHMKFVITATQMLESMIQNPRPTRAEASDVANAIFDGTDAVMLSGETASGQYPVESIATMNAIIHQAEDHYSQYGHCEVPEDSDIEDDAVSITHAVRELAQDRNVAAIAVFTRTGHTALLMSKVRPQVPILAMTFKQATLHQMGLYWGVTPILVPFANSVEEMIQIIERTIREKTSIQPGQQVVLVSGFPVSTFPKPNLALLHTIE
jgi:pyruvate kinase